MQRALEEMQRSVCQSYRADYDPPAPGSTIAVATQTMGASPVRGVRRPPAAGASGWFIYAGEDWSEDPAFFQTVSLEELAECCGLALPFLGLPPGWWFQTDGAGDYGASYDPRLLGRGSET
jgi:hypothetical protein